MKIYLAARYSRHKELQSVRTDLEKLGHIVTSRWINDDHQISDDGLSAQAKESERIRFATEDFSDLCEADAIIAFTEAPRSTTSRGGRHVELGMAMGRGMRIIIVGPRENVFCCLPTVEWYDNYVSFISNFK
jgi:nucleoside 2-deoxyribosyltransferase